MSTNFLRPTGSQFPKTNWKPLSEMDVMDNFLATEIFSGPEGKRFTEILLGAVLGREVEVEAVVSQAAYQGQEKANRAIQVDAVARERLPGAGGGIVVYNTELEHFSRIREHEQKSSLPRRIRYHQSLIDASESKSGTPFSELPDIVNIFITDFDPFGRKSMYYEVRNCFITHDNLDYNDGLRKIFLYTEGENPPGERMEELQNLLQYIRHSEKRYITDDATREMDSIVQRVKQNAEVNSRYMLAFERDYFLRESAKDEVRQELAPQLAEKDRVIAEKDSVIADNERAIAEKDSVIAEKDSVIADNERAIANLTARIQELEKAQRGGDKPG